MFCCLLRLLLFEVKKIHHWQRSVYCVRGKRESHLVVYDVLRPHRLQPTRLLCWWGFPGKNTGGLPCPSPRDLPKAGTERRSPTLQVDSLPTEPPGKPRNTGVGSLSLLQGIFLTEGLNPGLLHCRLILYLLSHKGRPRILEWVAYPFSRESSWPRNQTGFSYIAGGFFTSWATREAHLKL